MARKDVLKQLIDQLFPDNDDELITPAIVRQFLAELVDFIPEEAGGDLTGTYPDPTIAAQAVTMGKIASNAVTSGKLATGAVTTAKVADAAITDVKIASGAITHDKLARHLQLCRISPTAEIEVHTNTVIKLTDLIQYDPEFGLSTTIIKFFPNEGITDPCVSISSEDIPSSLLDKLPTFVPIEFYYADTNSNRFAYLGLGFNCVNGTYNSFHKTLEFNPMGTGATILFVKAKNGYNILSTEMYDSIY